MHGAVDRGDLLKLSTWWASRRSFAVDQMQPDPYCAPMNRTVICISHATGAGGPELGRLVADRLSFRLVDEEIVARAAEHQKVSVDDLANVERRKSLLTRILGDIAAGAAMGPADMYVSAYTTEIQPDGKSLRSLIRESINETADEGNVVIVSHAASYALSGRANVLRVLVTASPDVRARRLGDTNRLGDKEAAKSIADNDAGRADYLKRFYNVSAESPLHYDLVINTDLIPATKWADLLLTAASL